LQGRACCSQSTTPKTAIARVPKALAVVIDRVQDEDGDGAVSIADVEVFLRRNHAARIPLKGNDKYPGGDFRSPECIEFLKQADIVVTNPPFSLFREYVAQLIEHGKKFLIIGNKNAITYKEIFPLIKENKIWLGWDSPMETPTSAFLPTGFASSHLVSMMRQQDSSSFGMWAGSPTLTTGVAIRSCN
jgi:hypothetical protein